MGAYFVLYPQSRVLTAIFLVIFFDLVEIPAIFFLGIWFLLQLVSGVGSLGVSNAAGGGTRVLGAHRRIRGGRCWSGRSCEPETAVEYGAGIGDRGSGMREVRDGGVVSDAVTCDFSAHTGRNFSESAASLPDDPIPDPRIPDPRSPTTSSASSEYRETPWRARA